MYKFVKGTLDGDADQEKNIKSLWGNTRKLSIIVVSLEQFLTLHLLEKMDESLLRVKRKWE
ncbi:hypothetical protein CDB3_19875 [Bacillus sp. CDB3]|nr:hypothetical protein CDB3_19875 [Bacillus sp. CDB3]